MTIPWGHLRRASVSFRGSRRKLHLYGGGFSGMCNHNLLIVVHGPHMRSGDRRHRSIFIFYLSYKGRFVS